MNRNFLWVFSLFFSLLIFTSAIKINDLNMVVVISEYQADNQMMNRKYPIKYSDAYFKRMHQFYQDWDKKLKSIDYAKLSVNEQVDYQLLKRNISINYKQLMENEVAKNKLLPILSWKNYIEEFQRLRSVGTVQDGNKVAKDFEFLISKVDETIKTLDNYNEIEAKDFVKAYEIAEQYRLALVESFKFYDGYDPVFTQQVKPIYLKAESSLRNLIKAYSVKSAKVKQVDDGSGIIGNPIGREAFIKALEGEMIAYTPEELIDVALKEFAWSDREMLKASNEMGFGDDWKKALEKVKGDYVPQGKQPELIKFLADEAVEFIESKNLITIPELAKEGWSMRMLSAQEQLTAPFFLGGESILIAYPTDGMTDTAKMMSLRGNNKHFARATVHHELIPGHNLQYYMQNRYKTYRRPFGTPFWSEGWALYWEMLLWDNNFAKSPENRVGMLFWRMHRSARIIFSTNYHLGKWTPQQCIDFLVNRVGFERANAEAEVRRSFTGGYGPLYQIAYMIGGLQFRALHKEMVASGKMTNKAFHDKILQNNSMPVDLVRVILNNKPIPENYKANWKFVDKL
ncbi:DUF885 domain-containing protein [Pedobacter flavus]|uniref:DUF885 domain-containing protein n=1 Tax=Pedobacter flavus TaxID=3113906 RepID=A0ABU7GYN9_9SPHI|nr:DUF885 domain-containing protein [Pedobacter sp. VNH31]MEE1884144.1 DUF885 domain-containing protein [Pedobacter sp. VNH31]